jgi:CheY-like chemotaxis protein
VLAHSRSHLPAAPYLLIADDEAGVLDVTRAMAVSLGWQPLLANTAEHALALFREHRDAIHHVLLDLHMPGVDGAGLARALRESRADVRLYLMTGDDLRAHDLLANGEFADGVLVKPFVLSQLERALEPRAEAA